MLLQWLVAVARCVRLVLAFAFSFIALTSCSPGLRLRNLPLCVFILVASCNGSLIVDVGLRLELGMLNLKCSEKLAPQFVLSYHPYIIYVSQFNQYPPSSFDILVANILVLI